MIAILLSLTGAGLWGAADFFGGLASRRTSALSVVIISQLVAFVTVLAAMLVLRGHAVRADYLWGAATGAAASVGLLLLYGGLGLGAMAIVAPITAVCAVIIPVIVGLVLGERPSVVALAGIVVALAAIVLVSQGQSEHAAESETQHEHHRHGASRRAVMYALGAGVAIGFSYVFLARASRESMLVPLAVARVTAVLILVVLALVTRRSIAAPRPTLGIIAWSGVLDTSGNLCYVIAVHRGMLALVATLVSLYPAGTVILARLVLRERMSRAQLAGFALALVAVVMIASG